MIEISKEWCLAAAQREGDGEIGAGALAMDPVPDVGADPAVIVDLIKQVDRAEAIALLQQTLVVARGAGFMEGMKHMDGVTQKALDSFAPKQKT